MQQLYYNECFKAHIKFVSHLFITPVINDYITIPITNK